MRIVTLFLCVNMKEECAVYKGKKMIKLCGGQEDAYKER